MSTPELEQETQSLLNEETREAVKATWTIVVASILLLSKPALIMTTLEFVCISLISIVTRNQPEKGVLFMDALRDRVNLRLPKIKDRHGYPGDAEV